MISTWVVELIALGMLLFSVIDGWFRGLLMKVYGLVRFILLIIMTIILTVGLWYVIPLEGGARAGAAFLAALIISSIILAVIARILKIVDKIPVVSTFNRIGGVIVGLILGLLVLWVTILVIAQFKNVQWCREVTEAVSGSAFLSKLQALTPADIFVK